MKVHELKTINPYFKDVAAGLKDFEIRKNDRDFEIGDILKLVEFNPLTGLKTGWCVVIRIKYIIHGGQYGIANDYVVLGLHQFEYFKNNS